MFSIISIVPTPSTSSQSNKMPTLNNLRLLFLTLLFSFHYARPDNFPSPSPAPEPDSSSGSPPTSSPSPVADGSATVSGNPSPSPSPVSEGPSPSPSLVADGPNTVSDDPSPSPSPVFDGLSPSPEAAGPAPVSDSPSPSPIADGPVTVSDDSSPSPSPSPSPEAETRRSRPNLSQSPEASDGFGPSAADLTPKVKQMCDSTGHPEICQALLLPGRDGNTDVPAMLETAIRATAQLANIGLVLAKSTTSRPGVPPELASILMDCRDSYDYAVYNFESTLEAFPKRDVGAMRSTLSAVIKDVDDCEDGLKRHGKESPFADVAEKLVNMTNNCLAIVSLLN